MNNVLRKIIILVTVLFILYLTYRLWHAAPTANTPTNPPVVTTTPYADLIHVDAPLSGTTVTSPVHVSGRARGTWYFEASFSAVLETIGGERLSATSAHALGDWMTSEFVPFEAEVVFTVTSTRPARLILSADNPSGMTENDKSISIPIVLSP